jgi:hypothetical protein
MSERVGSTITLEAWDPSLKPNLDWNHAWGAAPANLIPRFLMGIEPLEPGFKRFRVQPQLAQLTAAEVKTPTPRGPIQLSIRQPDMGPWQAEITVPAGTTAEFHLPTSDLKQATLSSSTLKQIGEAHGRAVVELTAGTHRLQVARPVAAPKGLRGIER